MKGFLTSPKNDTIDKFKKQMMAPIPGNVTFYVFRLNTNISN